MQEDTPRPDQIPGAPHPSETVKLVGQAAPVAEFSEAYSADRLHHGWLLTGPRGVGKATLAYRLAHLLLTAPPGTQTENSLFGAPSPAPDPLDLPQDAGLAARIRAGAEPGLRVVTRSVGDTGRLRAEIVVDDIRKLGEFFHLSRPDGGHRVVIVDAADEMNTSAANALLKMLEEPPAATTLFLVAHQPSRLLPTIRSRCRALRLSPLGPDDLTVALAQTGAPQEALTPALAELSGGSVGDALRLANLQGIEIYAELVALMSRMPRLDRTRALKLADAAATRGAEARLDLTIDLLNMALARLARTGARGTAAPDAAPDEAKTFLRLAPDSGAARLWAERSSEVMARLRHGRAVNLDPATLLLDTLHKLNETAGAAIPARTLT